MPTRNVKTSWYFRRIDSLEQSGFTPEEAAIIANVKISAPGIKKLIRGREQLVANLMNRGISREDALRAVQQGVRNSGGEIINWTLFREILYPKKEGF